MAIDFDLLRNLMRKVENTSEPLTIRPELPFVSMTEPGASGGLSISISVPKAEGTEFEHWRFLTELQMIRTSHNGRPGLSKSGGQVDGIKPKGREFLELSRDEDAWRNAMKRCVAASATSMSLLMSELRKEARKRLRQQEKGS